MQEGSPVHGPTNKRTWNEAMEQGGSSEEEKTSSKTTDLIATPRASKLNKATCRASPKFLNMMIEHVITSPGKFQGTLAQELKSSDGLERVLGMVSKNKKKIALPTTGEDSGAQEVLEQLTRSVLEQRDSHVRKTKKPATDEELEMLRHEDPKRYHRILLNREAAARSKAKKKEEEERMKVQILHMKEEQARLREQINSLHAIFMNLKNEIASTKASLNDYDFIDPL